MKKIDIKKYILILIGNAIITFSFYLNKNIYNASFEQYIYSLIKVTGMSGTPIVSVIIIILYGFILYMILNIITILPTINFDRKITINIKKKQEKKEILILPIKNIKRYGRIILAISIIYLGITVKFFDYAFNSLRNTDLFKDHYVEANNVEIKFPEEKQNLIYIILESTEMTNVSKVWVWP